MDALNHAPEAGNRPRAISGSEGGGGKHAGTSSPQAGGPKQGKTPANRRRTGITRPHYERQKGTAFAYFRVNIQDAASMGNSQFTIYNFITNSFAFSPSRKELTLRLLESLKEEPKAFSALATGLSAPKGSLYLLCLSLERSGFVRKQPDGRYCLDTSFSAALREYASWWEGWVGKK